MKVSKFFYTTLCTCYAIVYLCAHNRKHTVLICTQYGCDIVAGLCIMCNIITHCHNSEAIILKCTVAKITSDAQSYLLKCFIVYWSNCLKIIEKRLLGYSYNQLAYRKGHTHFRSSAYTPLLKASKPTPSISFYNTQVHTIKQLLYYQETLLCVGA